MHIFVSGHNCVLCGLQVIQYQTVRYPLMPVSPILRHRLSEYLFSGNNFYAATFVVFQLGLPYSGNLLPGYPSGNTVGTRVPVRKRK